MVQAARSGRQNIAEGSMEELKLDYEDYLRQRGFPQWEPSHPALVRFKEKRCSNLEDFRLWVARETLMDKHGHTRALTRTVLSVKVRVRLCMSPMERCPC